MSAPSRGPHNTKVVVWGFGSIGRRHARILHELGCTVAIVTRQTISEFPCFSSISTAVTAVLPEYCVICTATADHSRDLASLAATGFSGVVLVEKPLTRLPEAPPAHSFTGLYVGYNLRFHPMIQAVRKKLQGEMVHQATWRTGQYLPDWRPGTDYKQSYSARSASGGGVLRDLSHEIDLALWLFGPWRRLTALVGHVSSLELDSEDSASLLLTCDRCCQLSIQVNYLDRQPVRQFIITTADTTLKGDIIAGTLTCGGVTESFPLSRDFTYRRQHEAVLDGDREDLCGFESGQQVVELIFAAEQASNNCHWKTNP